MLVLSVEEPWPVDHMDGDETDASVCAEHVVLETISLVGVVLRMQLFHVSQLLIRILQVRLHGFLARCIALDCEQRRPQSR